MRQYSASSTVNAAKIIAIQRTSVGTLYDALVIYETPEVSASASAYISVTSAWITANAPVVGGYLIDKGSDTYGFMPATVFEAVYALVTTP